MSRAAALTVATATLLADQITKMLVRTRVGEFDSVVLIPGYLNAIRSSNRGIAFGMLADSASSWTVVALSCIGVVVMLVIGWLMWHAAATPGQGRITLALALILGGAAGNLVDRLMHGEVTDFLDFYIGTWHWYTFNVADAAITIAAVLLLVDIVFPRRASNPAA